MRYILPAGALTKLDFLRPQYQEARKVDLEKEPTAIGLPTLLGGTDIEARRAQIQFLEKIRVVFDANIKKAEECYTPEELTASLAASRVVIAACLYVKSQISRPKAHSALYNLINTSLGITAENFLDEEDKEMCYLAADRIIHSSLAAFDDANTALRKAGMEPLSEREWRDFSDHLRSISYKKVKENPYTTYPITSITRPLFGAAFSYTGATLGFLGGDVVSKSTTVMATKYKLTAAIGSTIIMFGSGGSMGVALLSQVVATKLITTFCSISLANVMGTVMGIVGQGVGVGVGLPLDVAYRLLWKACSVIGEYYGSHVNSSTGLRICDGKTVIGGIAIEMTSVDQLPEGFTQKTLELKEDGKLYLDGELLEIPESGSVALPPDLVAQLRLQVEESMKEPVAEAGPAM